MAKNAFLLIADLLLKRDDALDDAKLVHSGRTIEFAMAEELVRLAREQADERRLPPDPVYQFPMGPEIFAEIQTRNYDLKKHLKVFWRDIDGFDLVDRFLDDIRYELGYPVVDENSFMKSHRDRLKEKKMNPDARLFWQAVRGLVALREEHVNEIIRMFKSDL